MYVHSCHFKDISIKIQQNVWKVKIVWMCFCKYSMLRKLNLHWFGAFACKSQLIYIETWKWAFTLSYFILTYSLVTNFTTCFWGTEATLQVNFTLVMYLGKYHKQKALLPWVALRRFIMWHISGKYIKKTIDNIQQKVTCYRLLSFQSLKLWFDVSSYLKQQISGQIHHMISGMLTGHIFDCLSVFLSHVIIVGAFSHL